MEQVLLHGILEATIFEVDVLPGGNCCYLFSKMIDRFEGKAKLYATVELGNTRVEKTRLVENDTSNPQWHESFRIYCAHKVSDVVFTLKRHNSVGADTIGKSRLSATHLLAGKELDRWLNLDRSDTKIHIKCRFIDASNDKDWSKGIASPKFSGVPYTFFPQRNNCRVTLYQDAHVPDGKIPKIPLARDDFYRPNRCWEDVFDAIYNAEQFVYIAGWSVCTKITLIRDEQRRKIGSDLSLGELLKKKAKDGVRVLMLVWDDRTSVRLLKDDGVMATHDEDTGKYFENSGVHCVLCPREDDGQAGIVRDFEVSTMFTHHQKIVVVDGESVSSENKRNVVSFIGGIDLCDGRYDTPSHSLFATLETTHRNDFHQPNFRGAEASKGGPREPWHDAHCRLEGPVARDVLFSFEQRWRKQADKSNLLELTGVCAPPSPASSGEDPDSYNVQLFRSIDRGSVLGIPIPDRSIQDAYISAIRRAKSFVYIENQYFLGSSFAWKDGEGKEVNASHLIPKEISLKIAAKIGAGERFTAYIVIPMWPEGIPESGSVQAILHWQRLTMEMMYKDVAEAIKAKGVEADPRDYLTFFCLGNRESKKCGEYQPEKPPEKDAGDGKPPCLALPACFCRRGCEGDEKPPSDSDYGRAQKSRRFMIYVHAKMMIVDDEYIIIGSANINQRSMDGARDTEIAMGAFQPRHLSGEVGPARGQIHGHRLALWYEHTGMLDDSFLRPESLECVRKVNRAADEFWDLYTCENALDNDLSGHLLRYPIRVNKNGDVTNLAGVEFFPDTKARVLGSKSDILPSILTT